MIAVTVVVLMKVVGLILVIAFLSLPAATAAVFTKRIGSIIITSSLLSFLFSFSGLFVSYSYNLPTGAAITVVAGVVYLLSIISGRYHAKLFK
jgi:zinc transport system permease protein